MTLSSFPVPKDGKFEFAAAKRISRRVQVRCTCRSPAAYAGPVRQDKKARLARQKRSRPAGQGRLLRVDLIFSGHFQQGCDLFFAQDFSIFYLGCQGLDKLFIVVSSASLFDRFSPLGDF